MQDIVEIDIREMLFLLLSKIRWIILATLVGGLIAFGITYWFLIPHYTSSVSMYVNNNSQDEQAALAALNLNDINASQKLVATYIVIIQDDEVLEQVAYQLTQDYTRTSLEAIFPFVETEQGAVVSPDAIRKAISLSAVNNTEILRIEASTPNAELSARICTLLTELAPEVLMRVVKAGSVEVIGEARIADEPSSPNRMLNCLIGALAGAILSVMLILLTELMDNTIKDEEDFRKRYDLPVLGEIPEFVMEKKGRTSRYGAYQLEAEKADK